MEEAKQTLTRLDLYIDADAQALICRRAGCLCVISTNGSRVATHLHNKHGVLLEARRGLRKVLTTLCPAGFQAPDAIPPREDGSPEHPCLQTHDGYACHGCRFRTVSLQLMNRHFSDEAMRGQCSCYGRARGLTRSTIDELFQYVYLQSWQGGPNRSYWVVERNGSSMRPIGGQLVQETLRSIRQRELVYRQKREGGDCPLSQDPGGSVPGAAGTSARLTFAERGPWLERAGWEETYQDVDLTVLCRLVLPPGSCLGCQEADLPLGHYYVDGQREDITSPARDEEKIQALLDLFDKVMDRCESTARATSRNMLCWLRSTKHSTCYTKPFTLVSSDASTKRYRRLFKQCITLALRAYRMAPEVRAKLVGDRFSRKQLRFLQMIWTHPSWDTASNPSCADRSTTMGHDSETLAEPEATSLLDDSDDDGDDADEGADCVVHKAASISGLHAISVPGDSTGDETDVADESGTDDDDDDGSYDRSTVGSAGDEDDISIPGERDASVVLSDTAQPGGQQQNNAELLEYLFGFAVSLCTQHLTDGKPNSTILVFASGILGFSCSSNAFLPARSYTSLLSGLIYVQRLLFLEFALPLQGYTTLGVKRRPRRNQLRQLEGIRSLYMVYGAQSSFEEMVSLRAFGRVIARTDSPAFVLRWSQDAQTLFQGVDLELSMGSFRRLPAYFIDHAERLCDELMFRWRPKIDLSKVGDDMQNTVRGFSFVQHPGNGLEEAYLELLERACTSRQRSLLRINGQGGGKAAVDYIKKEEILRETLAPCMQLAGGQLPRCRELLSLWCVNTEFGPRGIYVYNGAMIYITRHHKAKRSTNREFVVARFLPVQIGHLLYKYLVYIRPLIEMMHREAQRVCAMAPVDCSPLLFRTDMAVGAKPLATSRLTSILKQATQKVWGRPVNSQLLRQLCIGISEKHVREVHKPFNRFDDRGADADRNVVFAWQSGHRPLQRGSTYGLDGAFPTTLQPQLLHLYQWASTRWHEFLHLPSKTAPPLPITKSPSTLEGAMHTSPQVYSAEESPVHGAVESHWEPPTRSLLPTQMWDTPTARARTGDASLGITTLKRPMEHGDNLSRRKRRSPCPPATTPPPSNTRPIGRATIQEASPWAHGPLFGSIHSFTTVEAIEENHRLVSHLYERQATIRSLGDGEAEIVDLTRTTPDLLDADGMERPGEAYPWRLVHRLKCIHEHTEEWRFVGCEVCFLQTGAPEPDHVLVQCDSQPAAHVAKRILTWLESLATPRFFRGRGDCSMCGHSWAVCGEVRMGLRMSAAREGGDGEGYKKLSAQYDAEPGLNGSCENGPVVRRMIAALCAYDEQLLGKVLGKLALDCDHITLEHEPEARQWFERRVRSPSAEWVPGLLHVLDILLRAHAFRKAKSIMTPHSDASEADRSTSDDGHIYQLRWGTELEIQDWRAALDWVSKRCTFCAGRGLGDRHTMHPLRRCERGGAAATRGELGAMFYKDGILPSNGCDLCYLPFQFCSRWTKNSSGVWRMRPQTHCTYNRRLLCDSILGFASCGVDTYSYCLLEGAEDYYERMGDVSDGSLENAALWLVQPLVVAGVESSEMVRQLSFWVHQLMGQGARPTAERDETRTTRGSGVERAELSQRREGQRSDGGGGDDEMDFF